MHLEIIDGETRIDDARTLFAEYAASLGIEKIFCVGKESKHMYSAACSVSPDCASYFETQEELIRALPALVHQGDVILVKGSNSVGLSRLVAALADGER